jgi:hypothetical protein
LAKSIQTHVLLLGAALSLAACGGQQTFDDPTVRNPEALRQVGRVTGEEGLIIFGGRSRGEDQGGPVGLGVNSFLWRASLDTIAFMPLASADPFGGTIITDWYSDPATPGERVKATIYILDRQLRADGLRAAVFKQVRDSAGGWIDAPVDPRTGTDLENAILTRAREMRIAQAR